MVVSSFTFIRVMFSFCHTLDPVMPKISNPTPRCATVILLKCFKNLAEKSIFLFFSFFILMKIFTKTLQIIQNPKAIPIKPKILEVR